MFMKIAKWPLSKQFPLTILFGSGTRLARNEQWSREREIIHWIKAKTLKKLKRRNINKHTICDDHTRRQKALILFIKWKKRPIRNSQWPRRKELKGPNVATWIQLCRQPIHRVRVLSMAVICKDVVYAHYSHDCYDVLCALVPDAAAVNHTIKNWLIQP